MKNKVARHLGVEPAQIEYLREDDSEVVVLVNWGIKGTKRHTIALADLNKPTPKPEPTPLPALPEENNALAKEILEHADLEELKAISDRLGVDYTWNIKEETLRKKLGFQLEVGILGESLEEALRND